MMQFGSSETVMSSRGKSRFDVHPVNETLEAPAALKSSFLGPPSTVSGDVSSTEAHQLTAASTDSRMRMFSLYNAGRLETGELLNISQKHDPTKKGTFVGAYIPICETMWGVIIFLRFSQVVGYAGVGLAVGTVMICATVIYLTITSLCAVATNGVVVSGGVYYMMSRSLGPAVGGSIGAIYFLGMSILSTVEIVGCSEALHDILFHMGDSNFSGSSYLDQIIISTSLLVILSGAVMIGLDFINKIALVFIVALLIAFVAGFAG
eukprot:Sdes_comp22163_c0_seq1m20678